MEEERESGYNEYRWNQKKRKGLQKLPDIYRQKIFEDKDAVIAQGCRQTLGLGLVDRNRTVVYSL